VWATAIGDPTDAMPLPDFVIVGERRCGTTSLYHALDRHPGVYLPPKTELSYFIEDELTSAHWIDGEADAAAWSATHDVAGYEALFREGEGAAAVGHKGADLLFWAAAHPRMARFAPEARLIVTLRDPTDRAWSQYWNEVGKGRETLGFEEALAEEESRAKRSDWARFHLSYRARGFYAASLSKLFEVFPRERVHVVTIGELKGRPDETMAGLCNFLGLDPSVGLAGAGERRNENWTTVPRPWADRPGLRPITRAYSKAMKKIVRPLAPTKEARRRALRKLEMPFRRPATGIPMSHETRDRLREFYAPSVEDLEKLLGRSFAEWKP